MKINPSQLNNLQPLRSSAVGGQQQIEAAQEVRDTFRTFVGEAFFGQMLKSMRSTLDKPAYFDGGRAEEVFRGQLDQILAQEMTEASADQFADPMFRSQFPKEASLLQRVDQQAKQTLNDLAQLRRR